MTYPLPSYAAHIWLTGDEINLTFPSPLDAPAHTVRFPANERGMKLALSILRDRASADRSDSLKLGHKAAPTQYMTEARYREITASIARDKAATAQEQAEAEGLLKELGF